MRVPDFSRRDFVAAATITGLGSVAGAAPNDDIVAGLDSIDTMPNVCAHEHWGSIPSIAPDDVGFVADNIAGAQSDETNLFDFLLCPYLNGFLNMGGFPGGQLARDSGYASPYEMAKDKPAEVLRAVKPHLENLRVAGTLTCTTLGIRELYGFDIDTVDERNFADISAEINTSYRDIFAWYRRAMAMAHFSDLIRPTGLSFMYEEQDHARAARELEFTRPILRIDDFITALPEPNSRVRYCIEKTGVEPQDAASWRAFLRRVFELAAEKGNVGIKQLQAYSRELLFLPREDADVDFVGGGDTRPFQDWVLHECLKLANEYGWPHQIHVGTDNLPDSNPFGLRNLFGMYPRVKFVMIHTWPFLTESAHIAHHTPNAYIDTCWLPILSPGHFEQALRTYLGYVPAHKIMLSHDATSVEMAAGSARLTRTHLKKILSERIRDGWMDETQALRLAKKMLHDNAVDVYALGG